MHVVLYPDSEVVCNDGYEQVWERRRLAGIRKNAGETPALPEGQNTMVRR